MSYDPKEIGAGKLITAKSDGEGGLNFFAGQTDITEEMGGGGFDGKITVEDELTIGSEELAGIIFLYNDAGDKYAVYVTDEGTLACVKQEEESGPVE